MSITAADIRKAFEDEEQAAGGRHMVDAKIALQAVAQKLGIPYERAREVMLNEWGGLIG